MDYAIIKNTKSGIKYKVTSFKSYLVDQSIDIPADYFNFTWGDARGEISNIISAGDEVWFYINDSLILNGLIDDFELNLDSQTDDINVTGRDKSLMLLDNDAMPKTFYNVTIEEYLQQVAPQYGITNFDIEDKGKFDKVIIRAGSSEWLTLDRLCKRKGLYPRYDLELLRCTSLRADSNVDYHFSNDSTDTIKIKSIKIKVSSDIKNEILVYSNGYKRGSDFTTSEAIKGSALDPTLKVLKRRVMHEMDLENIGDANSTAKQELKLANRKALTIEIVTHTIQAFYINKIAKVSIKSKNLDVLMLINKVTYSKDTNAGTTVKLELQLIEEATTVWNNHNIPTLPR